MKNLTRSETAEILRSHDNYAIITHRRPDGDTIGTSALLCMGLRQLGKNARNHPQVCPPAPGSDETCGRGGGFCGDGGCGIREYAAGLL